MTEELQLKLAQEIWNELKEDPKNGTYFKRKLSSDENLALSELLRRGVIKRTNGNYQVSPETKKFLDNNGKTDYELSKEKDEKRKDDTLKLSKISIVLSILAIVVSGIGLWSSSK